MHTNNRLVDWGSVQAIKKPTLLELCGPLFMSNPVITNLQYRLKESGGVTAITFRHQSFALGAGRVQKRKEWLGRLARAYAAASGIAAAPLKCGRLRSTEEENMCPACIASAAVIAAGAGSTGGILAVCIGKFREFFRANGLALFRKQGEIKWQQARGETGNTAKGISH